MGPTNVVHNRNDAARRCREVEGCRMVVGGEKEGWEKLALGGGFIKQISHVTFEHSFGVDI